MKQPISMIRGTTQPISIVVKATDGSNYVLADGEILRFGVKKKFDNPSGAYLIEKEMTSANLSESGAYILTLVPSDTEPLDFGTYYFDIGLQSGSNYYNVIECSKFNIEYNITLSEVVT